VLPAVQAQRVCQVTALRRSCTAVPTQKQEFSCGLTSCAHQLADDQMHWSLGLSARAMVPVVIV